MTTVIGTNGNDTLTVTAAAGQTTTVNTGNGNDSVTVHAATNSSTIVNAGNGADAVLGGTGSDLIVGGNGNDVLSGGAGNDILIGGGGADAMDGGFNNDLLISGSTTFDADPGSLLRLSLANNSPKTYAGKLKKNAVPPLNASGVVADADPDALTGGGGIDWFFSDGTDTLGDRAANEQLNI